MKRPQSHHQGPSVPELIVLNAPIVAATAGVANQRYTLPEGWYWELMSVSTGAVVGAPVTNQPALLQVVDGIIAQWSTPLAQDLPVAGFVGPVTWARDATGRTDGTQMVSTTPIPRSVVKGGWMIIVGFPAVGNVITLDVGVLIARAVAPVAAETSGVFETAVE